MVDEEIITSLKNAIEREEDLEDASQTLINAGYSVHEVNEARSYLQRGVLSSEVAKQEADSNAPITPIKSSFFSSLKNKIKSVFSKKSVAQEEPEVRDKIPSLNIQSLQSPKSQKNILLIVAIIILILLIATLSLAIIFKDSIINFLS